MQFAVCENAGIEILLSPVAQVFVFSKDLLEQLVDVFELIVWCLVMSVYFIFHLGLRGADRDASLNVEEHRAARRSANIKHRTARSQLAALTRL